MEASRQKERDQLEAAEYKLRTKMENWAGHPMKNHVRVLLCTLPDVLW